MVRERAPRQRPRARVVLHWAMCAPGSWGVSLTDLSTPIRVHLGDHVEELLVRRLLAHGCARQRHRVSALGLQPNSGVWGYAH